MNQKPKYYNKVPGYNKDTASILASPMPHAVYSINLFSREKDREMQIQKHKHTHTHTHTHRERERERERNRHGKRQRKGIIKN